MQMYDQNGNCWEPVEGLARDCALSKTCALRKADKCAPVYCADAYKYVNASADLPAVAGKVRRDVGHFGGKS